MFSLIPNENTTVSMLPFSFGISENTVFSNVIDSYHLVDDRYINNDRVHWSIILID
jgi:hypothetical protein